MSNWASIIGAIRISYIITPDLNEKILEEILENSLIQSTNKWKADNCNMPLGSEGSIQREIIFNKENIDVYILLFGSLRDVGEKLYDCATMEDIQNWFMKFIKYIDNYFKDRQLLKVYNATLFINDNHENISISYNPYTEDKEFYIKKWRI